MPLPKVTVRPFLPYLVCTIECEIVTLTLSQSASQVATKSSAGALPQNSALMNEIRVGRLAAAVDPHAAPGPLQPTASALTLVR